MRAMARVAPSERLVSPGRRLEAEVGLARARLDDLTAERQAIIEVSGAAVPDDEHDAEGSTIGFERARVSALTEAARAHLAELVEGMARLDAGSYGRCDACGQAISPERLDAIPAARHCLACSGSRSRHRLRPSPPVVG